MPLCLQVSSVTLAFLISEMGPGECATACFRRSAPPTSLASNTADGSNADPCKQCRGTLAIQYRIISGAALLASVEDGIVLGARAVLRMDTLPFVASSGT